MSETNKKVYDLNSYSFKEEGKTVPTITTGDSDSRTSEPIPEFPKAIEVDTHSFKIENDGTITRLDTKTGKKLGKVTDKKVIDAVKREQQAER